MADASHRAREELVESLAKTWLVPVVVSALNVGVLSLIFPYHPFLFACLVALAGVSVFLLVAARRLPRRGRARIGLLISSLAFALAAVATGAAGPVLLRRPTYVYLAPDWNPIHSRFVRAPSPHVAVVVFSDPLRNALRPLWEYLGPFRVRILGYDPKGGGLVSFPVHGAYVVEERLAAGVLSRALEVPFLAPTVYVDVRAPYPIDRSHHGAFQFGVGLSSAPAISAESLEIEGPRWNTVRTSNPPTDVELAYAATLDAGLSLLVYGTPSGAMATLELASDLAPSPEERARLLCVLGNVASSLVSGGIGGLQALTLYNAAYAAALQAIETQPKGRLDPVLSWSVGELFRVYRSPLRQYKERAERLRPFVRATDQGEPATVSRRMRDFFEGSRRILEKGKQRRLTREEALSWFRRFFSEAMSQGPLPQRQTFGDLSLRTAALTDAEFEASALDARKTEDSAFRFTQQASGALVFLSLAGYRDVAVRGLFLLRQVASSAHSDLRAVLGLRLDWISEFLDSWPLKAFEHDDPLKALAGVDQQRGRGSHQLPCDSLYRTLAELARRYGDWPEDGPLPPGFPPTLDPLPASLGSWWDYSFLAAFCERSFWAYSAIHLAGPRGSSAHVTGEGLRRVVGSAYLLMADAHGRPFLPWIALVARLLEAENSAEYDEMRELIEKQLQLPYRDAVVIEKEGLGFGMLDPDSSEFQSLFGSPTSSVPAATRSPSPVKPSPGGASTR